jgi:surface antigen
VRHSLRQLPYAASTVLGLTAPALAAVLLTSSVPTSAAPVVTRDAAVADLPAPLHAPLLRTVTVAPVVRPVAQPVARATAVRPVVAPKRVTVAAPKPVAAVKTVTRTATAPKPTTSQTAQPKGSDDYPYRTQADFYAVDKWGFTQRQCVSFAAWRLAQHGDTITNDANVWGSAFSWDEAARKLGHTVTSKARVGAIAQWNAHEGSAFYAPGSAKANGTFTAGGYGHVGWVKQVYSDGSVLIEQYNLGDSRSYSVMRVKAPRYLVIG